MRTAGLDDRVYAALIVATRRWMPGVLRMGGSNRTICRFMASLRKFFFIKARDFVHAGEASIHIQNLLKSMHLDPALIRRIAICSYEGEMNVVIHGGDGILNMNMEDDRLTLEIIDEGPGIPDIQLAMQPGYSTASEEAREMGFGAGMGLPNMKKNADDILVESEPGKRTRACMTFFIGSTQKLQ